MNLILRGTVISILAITITGCSSVKDLRIYSETRDKQGVAAKQAWAAADQQSDIATQRTNNAALLAAQLKTEASAGRARRDTVLLLMLAESDPGSANVNTVGGLLGDAKKNLDTLTKGIDTSSTWGQVDKQRRELNADLLTLSLEFRRLGIATPTCPDIASGAAAKSIAKWRQNSTDPNAGMVDIYLDEIRKWCARDEQWKTLWESTFKTAGGQLGDSWKDLETAEQELADLQQQSSTAKQAYDQALAEYKAVEARYAEKPGDRTKLIELAQQAKSALERLEKTGDAFGSRLAAEERLSAIEEFLTTVSETKTGEAPPASASRVAKAFVLLPDTITSTKQWLAGAEKPNLVPLLMRKNYEQLNLDAANQRIKAMEIKVALLKAKVETIQLRVNAYHNVELLLSEKKLGGGANKDDLLKVRIADVDKVNAAGARVAVYEAATNYLDASGRLDAEVNKYHYKIAAAEHEKNLSLAEVNVKQWKSLIGTSIDQLADYGTTGITKEQLISFFNSATLLWIATGVN